jgi:hypothetical protein
MPSRSVKQAKVMSAISHGWHPSKGSVAKIPKKVAVEFHAADKGHKYGKGMHHKARGNKLAKALHIAHESAKRARGRKAKRLADGGSSDDEDKQQAITIRPVDQDTPSYPAGAAFGVLSPAEEAERSSNPISNAISGAATSLATLPQRALESSAEDVEHLGEPNYEPQSIGPAVETAMNMVGGSGVVPAEANSLRTGLGILSQGKHLEDLPRMEKLEAAGLSPAQVFQKTGWYRGDDGLPRYWLSDQGAKLNPDLPTWDGDNFIPDDVEGRYLPYTLGEVWDHPDLYQAYPWLKDRVVLPTGPPNQYRGLYDPRTKAIYIAKLNPEDFQDTLHHEVVHAIQHHEGFANGGDLRMFLPSVYPELERKFFGHKQALEDQLYNLGYNWDQAKTAVFTPTNKLSPSDSALYSDLRKFNLIDQVRRLKNVEDNMDQIQANAYSKYLHLAGESEARDAPFIRRYPKATFPAGVPKRMNPEVAYSEQPLIVTPPFPKHVDVHGHEFNPDEGEIPDEGTYAEGGKVKAEKALPADHRLGMKVPKGGSMCANCKFLASPTTCGNEGFIKWNGSEKLPHPAHEYCCDNYAISKQETKAEGGPVKKKEKDPADHEFINFADGGLIDSSIPGRTDKIPMKVPPGSYVLPADIPSALGQGNTKAGSDVLKKMFTHSAYGLDPMKSKAQKFHFDSFPSIGRSHTEGGKTGDDHAKIVAAGGEFVIHPDVVKEIGNGDVNKGHKVLDRFVLHTRKQHIKTLRGLKGPKT